VRFAVVDERLWPGDDWDAVGELDVACGDFGELGEVVGADVAGQVGAEDLDQRARCRERLLLWTAAMPPSPDKALLSASRNRSNCRI
jgi:hypothetical protein